jgi:Tol biopolymer transport system component
LWRFEPGTSRSYDAYLFSFAERKLIPLSITAAAEFPGDFSPDGRWVGYTSNQSGREELYVASLPDLRTRKQVSTNGAQVGFWTGPRELWLHQPDGAWCSVTLEDRADGSLSVTAPRVLFRSKEISFLEPRPGSDRILASREATEDRSPYVVLVNDWKKLLPH